MVVKNRNNRIPEDILANDTPTKYAHLGWRVLCTFLSWVLLGQSISAGSTFFASVAVFVLPLLLDYYKYTTTHKARKIINLIAKGVNWLFLMCAFLGMAGIIVIRNQDNELIIETAETFVFHNCFITDVKIFWTSMVLLVFICLVDWCANVTTLESNIINSKKERK